MNVVEKNAAELRIKTIFSTRYLSILILIGIAFTSCTDNTFELSTLQNDIDNQAYVDILEHELKSLPNNAQVAVGLVYNGNTEYFGAINENSVLKGIDNADNIFEIGSITKVFTSICLSEMVDKNEASLKEQLQNQFDFPLQAGGDITFQQLANHTSGLPSLPTNIDEVQGLDVEDPYRVYTHDNLKSYLQNHVVLNSISGTTYEYSNLATGILGYTLARKRNISFEEMLQSIILNPLGMTSTTTLLTNVDEAKLVEPRDIDGNIVSHWNFAETMSGAGSLKSSVMDMTKFIQKNFENDDVYNLPQDATFDSGKNESTGLGWIILEEDGFLIHFHDGGTGGFSSVLMIDKSKKIGVILLSNVEDYHGTTYSICRDLMAEISN